MTPVYHHPIDGPLSAHLPREWLLTNGLGGYAAGTVVGCNTRRYHGLLCAATLPPVGRIMVVNRVAEHLILGGDEAKHHELSVNQFGPDTFHPRGDRYLRCFTLGDVASFEFDVEGVRLSKEVQVPWLRNAVGVRYTILASANRAVELRLMPFITLRDFHSLRRVGAQYHVRPASRGIVLECGPHHVQLEMEGASFTHAPVWWYDHAYAVETERGLDDREDQWSPGQFVLRMSEGESVTFWASLPESKAPLNWETELVRRRAAIAAACLLGENIEAVGRAAGESSSATVGGILPCAPASETIQKLAHAANDFVVYRRSPDGADGTSILAGYPWFADWGRDTMIALPGLLLSTGRFAQARQVLSVFAQYASEGMIPNVFDDYTGEPHYNTVDASLWFVHACFEYRRLSGDESTFADRLMPACRAIIKGYREGTRFGIHMDASDGLITQGDRTTQLTWMDAKCGGIAFTPRQGKAVEINALWHHALVLMRETEAAAQVAESFRSVFWRGPFRGLADVVNEDGRDGSIRPNQIFAVSLPNSPLTAEQQAAVVEVVRRELLTPFGLRTLARSDPNYRGHYTGNQMQRDAAYHNGTIWPWPLGAFLEAYLKVNGRSAEAIAQARAWLAPLIEHLHHGGCVGQIGEVFDGDEPHRPGGCFAQAWSVAEVLRLAIELEI